MTATTTQPDSVRPASHWQPADDLVDPPSILPSNPHDIATVSSNGSVVATTPSCPPATRSLLVIASRFPPVAAVGALRVAKFCKYLREFGWAPVVITGAAAATDGHAESTAAARDASALADLPPDLSIHRLPAEVDHWPRAATSRWAERIARFTTPSGWSRDDVFAALSWRVQGWRQRASFPDAGIWRLRETVRLAVELHRRHRFDAILSSAMPFSDHLVAMCVQHAIRRPWLADFRDPWVEYVHWDQWRTPWGERLTRWAEAAVVHRAARVISIGPTMRERFARRYSETMRSKFVYVRNGYDPADFANAAPTSPIDAKPANRTFRMVYLGSLYGGRNPRVMIDAFRAFLDRHPAARQFASLEFAGRLGPHADSMREAAASLPVRFHGLLPHSQAVALMQSADVMVVLQSDAPGTEIDVSAKIYEYLGSNRPILALLGAGDAADLLRKFDGVWQARPGDTGTIVAAMGDIFARWQIGRLQPQRRPEQLKPLTRRHQAGQLAALLDATLAQRHQRRDAHQASFHATPATIASLP